MSERLKGKTAIITGGGTGIGLATAKLFHAEGANVVLAGTSDASLRAADDLGNRAVAMRADMSRADDVQALVGLAAEKFGGLDILCNVAGASGPMFAFTECSEENFDTMVDVNLRAVFLTMKFAIPEMLKRGGGAIVNVSSTAALIGTPALGAYGAAKSGVVALTRTVALEYAKAGIRANSICPGPIDTPMLRAGLAQNPNATAYFQDLVPMGRIGQPEEVAAAILFFASPEASYITGATLPVEGGQTAA
jgi:NAD(P)-dependent dehydrogenase (short-subunit alcohol dehydrogenase family)